MEVAWGQLFIPLSVVVYLPEKSYYSKLRRGIKIGGAHPAQRIVCSCFVPDKYFVCFSIACCYQRRSTPCNTISLKCDNSPKTSLPVFACGLRIRDELGGNIIGSINAIVPV